MGLDIVKFTLQGLQTTHRILYPEKVDSTAAEVPVKFKSDGKSLYKLEFRGYETSRDLAVRRPSALWKEALELSWHPIQPGTVLISYGVCPSSVAPFSNMD